MGPGQAPPSIRCWDWEMPPQSRTALSLLPLPSLLPLLALSPSPSPPHPHANLPPQAARAWCLSTCHAKPPRRPASTFELSGDTQMNSHPCVLQAAARRFVSPMQACLTAWVGPPDLDGATWMKPPRPRRSMRRSGKSLGLRGKPRRLANMRARVGMCRARLACDGRQVTFRCNMIRSLAGEPPECQRKIAGVPKRVLA